MSLPSAPTFWERLAASRLLHPDTLQAARDETGETEDVRVLCRMLVIRHYLTRWQCKELLLDRTQFRLGKYLLLDQLGQGGMGMVFKARHITTERIVALKVMAKRGLETPNGVARFRREVQVIAALNHPHIITAIDADCDDDAGRHFLVMEYAEGHDLNYWLQHEHPLPIPWICECIRQTAIGLQHALERGMVHRDIKPSNLLAIADDIHSPPIVKILDMGMARYSEVEEDEELTATGQILGTPDYIAPEQAEDTTGADIRSDIFSLGCTFFKVLTGRVPFQGRNSMEKLMARAKRDAPPAGSMRDDIPASLDAVVAKMLARDPADRYQTPGDVAEALLPFTDFAPRSRPTRPRVRPSRTVAPDHPQAEFLAFLDQIDRDAQGERTGVGAPEATPIVGSVESSGVTGTRTRNGAGERHISLPPPSIPQPEPRAGEGQAIDEVYRPKRYPVEGDSHILTGVGAGLDPSRFDTDASSIAPDASSLAAAKAEVAVQEAVAVLDQTGGFDPDASTQVRTNAPSGGGGPTARPRPVPAARSVRPAESAVPRSTASESSSSRKYRFNWSERSALAARHRPKPKFPWTWVVGAGSLLPLLLIGYLAIFARRSKAAPQPPSQAATNGLGERRTPPANAQYFEWKGIPVGAQHSLNFLPKQAGPHRLQLDILEAEPGLVLTTYLDNRPIAPGRFVDEAFLKAKQPLDLGRHDLDGADHILRVEAELPSLRANFVDYGPWYQLGPFTIPAEGKGRNPLDMHLAAEDRFELTDAFSGRNDRKLNWTKTTLVEAGTSDLGRFWSAPEPVLGCVCRVLTATRKGTVKMYVGSQAPLIVSLNDKPLFVQNHSLREAEPYDKLVRLELKEGRNLLRIKFLVQDDRKEFFYADRTPPRTTWDTPLKFGLSIEPVDAGSAP